MKNFRFNLVAYVLGLGVSLLSMSALAAYTNGGMMMGGHSKGMIGSTKVITTTRALPPGLKGKEYPHGLKVQAKAPAGWSHGEKKGWIKSSK